MWEKLRGSRKGPMVSRSCCIVKISPSSVKCRMSIWNLLDVINETSLWVSPFPPLRQAWSIAWLRKAGVTQTVTSSHGFPEKIRLKSENWNKKQNARAGKQTIMHFCTMTCQIWDEKQEKWRRMGKHRQFVLLALCCRMKEEELTSSRALVSRELVRRSSEGGVIRIIGVVLSKSISYGYEPITNWHALGSTWRNGWCCDFADLGWDNYSSQSD